MLGHIKGILFTRGKRKNLPSSAYEGQPMYCTDTHVTYIGQGASKPLLPINIVELGETAQRPSHPVAGQLFIDIKLNKLIYWNGANWLDVMGNKV